MKWSDEDIKLVEKFIEIRNHGYYCDGAQLTNVYNRVLEKSVPTTNCGSCLRARVTELENALNKFKRSLEVVSNPADGLKENKVDNVPSSENNELTEPKKKVGRPKKK